MLQLQLVILAALGIISLGINHHRDGHSNLEMVPGERLQPLHSILVDSKNTEQTNKIKKEIENVGSWWTHIGGRLYSPVAKEFDPALRNATSFLAEGEGLRRVGVQDFYVAVAGTEENLPAAFQAHRVGGSSPYHILYMPNMSEEERLKVIKTHMGETQNKNHHGNRKKFHSLFHLSKGFTPFLPFVANQSYKTSLSFSQSMAEVNTVKSVTAEKYWAYLQDLVNFGTRAVDKPNASKVQNYFTNKFTSFGLKTCKQAVQIDGTPSNNILAFLPATASDSNPQIVTIGAHYDSRPFEGEAPGAEDNGSGSAALLSIAEALAKSTVGTKHHIVFVAFTGEELGLYGSKAYIDEFGSWGDECRTVLSSMMTTTSVKKTINTCKAAIIMDEIGWSSDKLDGHTVTLETREFAENPVMNHLAAASEKFNSAKFIDNNGVAGGNLNIVSSFNPFGSDHMPFLNVGKAAVLTINGDDEAYPNYHKKTDTIENVDKQLAIKITRMNLAALIRIANDD
eukprot:jgi/Bigna1/88440/estExt_fgenesh1_pg.C_320036